MTRTLVGRARAGVRVTLSVLLAIFAAHAVGVCLGEAPFIGPGSFDYPGFDIEYPFWPQVYFAYLHWALTGLAVACFAVVGIDGRPRRVTTVRRFAFLWLTFALGMILLRVGWEVAWTGRPFDDPGRLARHVLPSAIFSATLLALTYPAVAYVLTRWSKSGPRLIVAAAGLTGLVTAGLGYLFVSLRQLPADRGDDIWMSAAILGAFVGLAVGLAVWAIRQREGAG